MKAMPVKRKCIAIDRIKMIAIRRRTSEVTGVLRNARINMQDCATYRTKLESPVAKPSPASLNFPSKKPGRTIMARIATV